MRVWRTAIVVGLALAGCGSSGHRPARPGSALRADGRHVFVAARCGDCHALAAAGTRGGNGPDLDTSERLDRAQIRAALGAGANGMPDYTRLLTARQLAAVVEFVYAATHPRGR